MFVTELTAEHLAALCMAIIIIVLALIYWQSRTLVRLITAALLPHLRVKVISPDILRVSVPSDSRYSISRIGLKPRTASLAEQRLLGKLNKSGSQVYQDASLWTGVHHFQNGVKAVRFRAQPMPRGSRLVVTLTGHNLPTKRVTHLLPDDFPTHL
jgi:hypothetical protein